MSTEIKVLNADGSVGYTSFKRAKSFVRSRRAAWADELRSSIRFHPDHYAHKSCLTSAEHNRIVERLNQNREYDRIARPLRREELKHIPFAGNIDRLMGRGMSKRAGAAQVA